MDSFLPLDPVLSAYLASPAPPPTTTSNGGTSTTTTTTTTSNGGPPPPSVTATSASSTPSTMIHHPSLAGTAGGGGQGGGSFDGFSFSDWINTAPGSSAPGVASSAPGGSQFPPSFSPGTSQAIGSSSSLLAPGGETLFSTGDTVDLASFLNHHQQQHQQQQQLRRNSELDPTSGAEELARILAATQVPTATSSMGPGHGHAAIMSFSTPSNQIDMAGRVSSLPTSPNKSKGRKPRGGSGESPINGGGQGKGQDESSVPEAALHLLRLAGKREEDEEEDQNGRGEHEADSGEDVDAEGEDAIPESEDTSLHGSDEARLQALNAAEKKNGGVRRGMGKGKSKGKGKKKAQKKKRADEAFTANGDSSQQPGQRATQDQEQQVNRRTSGRVRKTIISDTKALFEDDSEADSSDAEDSDDGSVHQEEDDEDDEEEDEYEEDDPTNAGEGSKQKGKGKAKGIPVADTAAGKKRASTGGGGPAPKKPRTSMTSSVGSSTPNPAPRRPKRVAAPVTVPDRTFPLSVQKDTVHFARFYRTFPISSAFPPDSYVHRLRSIATSTPAHAQDESDRAAQRVVCMEVPEGAKWNKACDPFNLYAPKFVRGLGDDKAGLCPICAESVERGGEATEKWLKLKNSSYVYHMSYAHGISNLSGLPFSPPLQVRIINLAPTTKDARDHMMEGLCHKCNGWIPLLSVKNVEAVVPELIWWKHAKPCHGQSTISGEGNYYLEDDVYALVMGRKTGHAPSSAPGQIAVAPPPAPAAPAPAPILVHQVNHFPVQQMGDEASSPPSSELDF